MTGCILYQSPIPMRVKEFSVVNRDVDPAADTSPQESLKGEQ